jgi:hypothetical protein
MTDRNADYRGLGWKYGALTVQRAGAMLAPLTFIVAGGRQVSPMHVAPWADEPGNEGLARVQQRLRGEWPCVPFGSAVANPTAPPDWRPLMGNPDSGELPHGYGSNHDWQWEDDNDGRSLRLSIDYPLDSPISRLERTITPDPEAPAVDIELRIMVRAACRLPLGLHATFRLPEATGGARIEPAPFATGRTYPGTVEPGAPLFSIDDRFGTLASVPTRQGDTIDASRVPLMQPTVEQLQLVGIDGAVALVNEVEGYRVRLEWQKEHFPSLLLWYSNRGRKSHPWNGRHLALGLEPICSAFALGPAVGRANNPIAASGTPTAYSFAAGETLTTRYRIEAEAI